MMWAPDSQTFPEITISQDGLALASVAPSSGHRSARSLFAAADAIRSGDGGRAHELSVQGKSHQAKQDALDDKAAAWIFQGECGGGGGVGESTMVETTGDGEEVLHKRDMTRR